MFIPISQDSISLFRNYYNNKLKQDYQQSRLKSSFPKFYGRYNDLLSKYNIPPGGMSTDDFHTYWKAIVNHRIIYGFFFL